ncbi:alkaline phosphatase D family protein [Streptomyces mobaraensis]|uniref:Alkaline phosphatase n=1 Tax=Streptomyces mobaraensis TaxID=35621 RepID=A0A5N5W6F1_STRMB|nr:alkaline phosphatase D family protein [Streptomyces mobaraensis]KAB7843661.1 alkaline phosphatase [Streptomyces mobaraensis]
MAREMRQRRSDRELSGREVGEDPFTLGVASGDPLPDGVVLWTRLAPRPLEADGGLPAEGRIPVEWAVAADEELREIVQGGTAVADGADAHSVHVEVGGLDPARTYWYRFRCGRWTSPVGRTRTAPAPGADVRQVRVGLTSCQQYDEGYYTALAHLAREDDLDAVLFVGDYIYENEINAQAGARGYTGEQRLPEVFDHWLTTLDGYRLRYALGKTDADLRAAHAAHPWIVTWDDHEVENNYAAAVSQHNLPTDEFLRRRAAAYRAYWEHMPLREAQRPCGPDALLYRRFGYGDLVRFDVLDTRQYRSDQAYGDGWQYPGPESEDPARTLTGAEQEAWLLDGFRESSALWNVVVQQVAFCQRKGNVGRAKVSMDAWDGYPASRHRILQGARDAGVANLVVLSGDVHVHYAMDIKEDFDDPASATLGVEIVGTSVSSGFDGVERPDDWENVMRVNPHIKYYAERRGYVVVTFTPDAVRADYRVLPYATRPGAPVGTDASFVSRAGRPGFVPA